MGKLLIWLFTAGKLGKLLLMGGSMLLSMAAYTLVFGWRYAAGFLALLFFHEMGHYLAARQRGLQVGLPTFIPFVGAWVELKDQPHDVETEAYIGFAGPVAGTAAAMLCLWVAREQHSQLLLALAYSGCMLNLFNLIPLSPLDGGRITAIISPRVWLLGVPLLAALFFYHPSPMLILVAVLAWPQLKAAWQMRHLESDEGRAYYQVPLNTRANYAVFYLGLIAFLAMMSYSLHLQLARG